MCLQTTEKGVVVSHGSQVQVPEREQGGRQGETWARTGRLGSGRRASGRARRL